MVGFIERAWKMSLKLSGQKFGVVHPGSRTSRHNNTFDGLPLAKMDRTKDLGVRFSVSLASTEQVSMLL